MICVLFAICGLALYAQQASPGVPPDQDGCIGTSDGLSGRPGVLPAKNRVCKPVLPGMQAPQPSNDHDGGTFITFDVPGVVTGPYRGTSPSGINWVGTVTGSYPDANGTHGFVRTWNGNITSFDVPGASGTYPVAINPWGTITGGYCDNSGCPGFVRTPDGRITTFDVPGDVYGLLVSAINPEGAVTGVYLDANFIGYGFVRYLNGTIITFDVPGSGCDYGLNYAAAINPRGEIAGNYVADADCGLHGFLRDAHGNVTTFDPPGGDTGDTGGTLAPGPSAGINPEGAIASSYYQNMPGTPRFRGFLRKPNGTFETFDASTAGPCCTWTFAIALNEDGVITGYDNDGYSIFHGFVRSRRGDITLFDAPGSGTGVNQGTIPTAINAEQVVTGYYRDSQLGLHGFLRIPR